MKAENKQNTFNEEDRTEVYLIINPLEVDENLEVETLNHNKIMLERNIDESEFEDSFNEIIEEELDIDYQSNYFSISKSEHNINALKELIRILES